MTSLAAIRASNAQLTSATLPKIAVFVGATSGIGRATLTQFANKGYPLKAYIVGRNEEEFKPVLSELRASNKGAELIFLEGQISLMAVATRLTDEILRCEEHIDLLFLSAGFLPFLGRQETSERLELATAVGYYSRQIFIRRLLPLLRAAFQPGTDQYIPRIVNVLGTGVETTDLYLEDLELKQPGHFSVQSYAHHSATMTSVSLKRLAERPENSEVVFIHHHPGLVSTEIFKKSWGDQWSEDKVAGGPNAPSNTTRSSPEEAGARSMYVITSSQYGGIGVALAEGQTQGLTVNGTMKRSLFCVGDKLDTLQLGELLGKLERNGAADLIWNKTNELIGNYL
ncbi:hypothetical protein ASPFODRAFT_51765 [Aspergillus luchuensis CBS 106.47]|uniref:NmrA-like domain-containing protein n=1 Tax=Aspergillus luchuensis (strain CBS 106.47) TaxID=1137211 RepID=A0A1M3T5Q6_ASPLC|nr:hypothetical protein ASPFODRAFT_51765 [Aspergillus luchuensis CBS 106.47]